MKTQQFWKKWTFICGLIVATAGAIPSIYYIFGWKAKTDAEQSLQNSRIGDTHQAIEGIDNKLEKLNTKLDTKIERLSNDVSEIKGQVSTLLQIELNKAQNISARGDLASTPIQP